MRVCLGLFLLLAAMPLLAEDKPALPYPWDPGWVAASNVQELEALPESTLHLQLFDATDAMLGKLERLKLLQSLTVTGKYTDNGVRELEKLGTLRDLQIGCAQLNDRALTSIGKLRDLEWLGLEECSRITNTGLAQLEGLKNITWLIIHGSVQGGWDAVKNQKITDAGLKSLAAMPAMENLDISGCKQLEGRGFADCLPKMKSLKSLILRDCDSLGDDALLCLQKHPSLEKLELGSIEGLTAKGFKALESAKKLTSVTLSQTPVDAKCVESIAKVKTLEDFEVTGPAVIDDDALAALAGIKTLKKLTITNWNFDALPPYPGAEPEDNQPAAKITNNGLKALGKSKSLETLYFTGLGEITDAGIAQLGSLPLISLALINCGKLTEALLEHVVKIATVRRLIFSNQTMGPPGTEGESGPKITDRGLKLLAKLPALTELDLSGQRAITSAGLEALADVPTLIILKLNMQDWSAMPGAPKADPSPISDEGLAKLAALKYLEHLDVSGTSISDAGLKQLHGMTSLKELMIMACDKVTDAGVAELSAALPACSVMHKQPEFPG